MRDSDRNDEEACSRLAIGFDNIVASFMAPDIDISIGLISVLAHALGVDKICTGIDCLAAAQFAHLMKYNAPGML